MQPSNHLTLRQSIGLLAFAIVLTMGFGGLWPDWVYATLRWIAGSALALVIALAIVLGAALAFVLIVRPRR